MDLRRPSAITGDPMTDERMALVDLLQKSGDGDFQQAVAKAVLPRTETTAAVRRGSAHRQGR